MKGLKKITQMIENLNNAGKWGLYITVLSLVVTIIATIVTLLPSKTNNKLRDLSFELDESNTTYKENQLIKIERGEVCHDNKIGYLANGDIRIKLYSLTKEGTKEIILSKSWKRKDLAIKYDNQDCINFEYEMEKQNPGKYLIEVKAIDQRGDEMTMKKKFLVVSPPKTFDIKLSKNEIELDQIDEELDISGYISDKNGINNLYLNGKEFLEPDIFNLTYYLKENPSSFNKIKLKLVTQGEKDEANNTIFFQGTFQLPKNIQPGNYIFGVIVRDSDWTKLDYVRNPNNKQEFEDELKVNGKPEIRNIEHKEQYFYNEKVNIKFEVCDRNLNDLKDVSIKFLNQDEPYKENLTWTPNSNQECFLVHHTINLESDRNKFRIGKNEFTITAIDKSDQPVSNQQHFIVKEPPVPDSEL